MKLQRIISRWYHTIPHLLWVWLTIATIAECCITLLDSKWKPLPIEERTRLANVVLTARILFTSPIPGRLYFYGATFRVLSVLKGWDTIRHLYRNKSPSVVRLQPDIIASAKGFADPRLCFSPVEAGETYVLFLGHKLKGEEELVAKYDDIFGAADLYSRRKERDILRYLGWQDWSSWSPCSASCDTGTQRRKRRCTRNTPGDCQGPSEQLKECNSFACDKTSDVLSFIVQQYSYHNPTSRFTNGIFNSIDQVRAPAALTYLLFPSNFPQNFVVAASFKGPVKSKEYLFSVYDVNNKMHFGIRLSTYYLDFMYDVTVDASVNKRQFHSFPYDFTDDIWYVIGVQVQDEEIKVTVNCEEIGKAFPAVKIMEGFDMFGLMYIGADIDVKGNVFQGEIAHVLIVSDTESLWKQCGRVRMDTPILSGMAISGDNGSGTDNEIITEGEDDSESGDVDEIDQFKAGSKINEEVSSGEGEEGEVEHTICFCENGGTCGEDGACQCINGWTGPMCSEAVCEPGCKQGGKCIKPNTCSCKEGTRGDICQYSQCESNCQNGGICIGPNICKCGPGFDGRFCEQVSCSKICNNGGQCGDRGKCNCPDNFKGDRCQYPEKCKRFITKMVSHLQPATRAVERTDRMPCKPGQTKMCRVKRVIYANTHRLMYRQEYVCAE